jgi:hypothetical protein
MTPTQHRAAIARAAAKARRLLSKQDIRQKVELAQVYRQAAQDIASIIANQPVPTLRTEVLSQLLNDINQRLRTLGDTRNDVLMRNINAAATLGANPWASGSHATALAHDAVRFTVEHKYADGLALSDRLWRADKNARDAVGQTITQAVVQGQSASQAAAELVRQGMGDSLPPDIERGLAQTAPAQVARRVQRQIFTTTNANTAYAQALRLARTEINRAHGEAYRAGAFEDEEVIGTRFLLSPRHPKADVCDMHARVNRYGLGPGVYPKGRSPWPAHPNTLSFEEAVWRDEITDDDKAGKEDRVQWLQKQSRSRREAVLGGKWKADAFDAGHVGERSITTPKRVLQKRIAKQIQAPAPTAPPLQSPPVQPARTDGAPVSHALTPTTGPKARTTQVYNETLAAIDSVHGDGQLPAIPLKQTRKQRTLGAYWRTHTGQPVKIDLSSQGGHPHLTLAHEIGHFLDHAGIGSASGFATDADDRLNGWRAAVRQSKAVQQIQAHRGLYPDARRYQRYLASAKEVWARSYAQYIATRSDSALLKRELREEQQRATDSPLPRQWADDDFVDIAQAFDDLFLELGWMTKRKK